MKKLILIIAFLSITGSAFAQRNYYYKNRYEKALTFQASVDVIDYDGMKYGWSLGANYKEILSLNYFHVRDYKATETSWMDSRFGGLHGSLLVPVAECLQVGGGMRIAYLNRGTEQQGQPTIYSAEVRMDLSNSMKLGFEYGKSSTQTLSAVRLIWNLY